MKPDHIGKHAWYKDHGYGIRCGAAGCRRLGYFTCACGIRRCEPHLFAWKNNHRKRPARRAA